MKKKPIAEPIIAPEILNPKVLGPKVLSLDKRSVKVQSPLANVACSICGSTSTPLTGPQTSDDLCWICRRLKISAWRDSDQQVSAHE